MKEIEEIKKWFESQTVWSLICIFSMLFLLIGLTAGYLAGDYRASAKITEQLEDHAVSNSDLLQNWQLPTYNYFSIDGKYLYYIVKTNISIENYKISIPTGGNEKP